MCLGGVLLLNGLRLTEGWYRSKTESTYFSNYYLVGKAMVEAGAKVRENTAENALLVTVYGGLDCRAPHFLYRARRHGWSIPEQYLAKELMSQLQEIGATHLAWVHRGDQPPPTVDFLDQYEFSEHPLGNGNCTLLLYNLPVIEALGQP